jgi:hypothetical protein
MLKLLIVALSMVIGNAMSQPQFERPVEGTVEKPVKRYEQYNLRLNKVISDECRVAIFVNKNETHFIKVNFSIYSLVPFESFMQEQDQNLKESPNKFDLFETLGGKAKNLIFAMNTEGAITLRYQLLNPEEQVYQSEDALLFEGPNHCK